MKRKKLLNCSIILASGFVINSHVYAVDDNIALTFRTHYGQVDRHFGAEDSEEMSFTAKLDYASDYYKDLIGFDASIYSVSKLYADKNTARIPLLDENGDGFSKIGQANIKLKPNDNMTLRMGRMRIISPLMTDTDGRSEPGTREALRGDVQIGGAKLYGIYSTAAAASGYDSFEQYTDDGDAVVIVGGRYRFENGLGVHLAHGQLQDAKRQTFISGHYGIPVGEDNLDFDIYHYMAKGIGDQSNLADNPGSDGKLDTYLSNIVVAYSHKDLTYSLSYQRVGDDLYEPSWDGFNHDRSVLWTNNSVQILDFYSPQEESLQVRVDYAPSQIPGFTLMTRYTEGDYKDGDEKLKDSEFNLEAGYVVQTGVAKDLALKMRYADVEVGGVGNLEDIRLIAEYGFSF
ncbi:vanillate porin [Marinobacterium zhoushanense]|uniref:Vanillate porin n=1 Tax=Marinobacterium zhoushanense TaxID=1679163 RepID=A0ABQ1KSB8_9GAMM|nr:OprD family outer membrane porin [Marinobacterium zhoushanense]GGC04801.1 vanillate porin [Marinobacterium zhoushanense]